MSKRIKRVIRVKSCNTNKNQECFASRKDAMLYRKKSRSSKSRISKKVPSKRHSKNRVRKISKPISKPISMPRKVSRKRSGSKKRRVSRKSSGSKKRRVSRKSSGSKKRRVSRKSSGNRKSNESRKSNGNRKRRSVNRKRRVSRKSSGSRKRRSVNRKRRSGHKEFVLSKSKDIASQVKNFFKIDQEIIYIIQHPKKAKRNNVLKLLAAIILFLLLLCAILKMIGAPYDCETIITKIKDIFNSVKNGTMDPMEALSKLRSNMANLWNKFKVLGPVVALIAGTKNIGRKGKDKYNDLFSKPIPAPSVSSSSSSSSFSTPPSTPPSTPSSSIFSNIFHSSPSSPSPLVKITIDKSTTTFEDLIKKVRNDDKLSDRIKTLLVSYINDASKGKKSNSPIGDTFTQNLEFNKYITFTS
jgi:hypothetical protein